MNDRFPRAPVLPRSWPGWATLQARPASSCLACHPKRWTYCSLPRRYPPGRARGRHLGLRGVLAHPRRVRVGLRIALAGAVLLGLFAVQTVVQMVRTGRVPEVFALFGLGMLLAIVGQLLFAPRAPPGRQCRLAPTNRRRLGRGGRTFHRRVPDDRALVSPVDP
jgi:hypothetical protein